MIGRNIISLVTKIKDLLTKEKRKEFNESKSQYFLYAALILTAVLGIICGIVLLFPNQIFGYYLFIIVSGMMIYSYISYAGKTYESKNWVMFVVSILVTILIMILASLLIFYLATGIID
jgi:4-hydroxybenzoate polyprenyltransferase